jgi:hypothetical protein
MKIELKERIQNELQGKEPQKIKELILDNCTATSLTGLSSEFESLETFKLIDAGLTSLKGFPKLTSLKKLELSANLLNEGFEDLTSCENIEYLDLKGNKIQTVEQLMPLTKLPNLKRLELLNCEIASMDNYREQIFKLFPNLEFLDGLDKEGHECAEDEECENDESEEDSEEEGDESHEVGLSYLNKEDLEDEEDDEEFDPEKVANATCEEDEDEDDIDEEEIKAISEGVEIDNENSNSRSGLKRKLDESCD